MPQGEYMELHRKRFGRRMDAGERERKAEARAPKKNSVIAGRLIGLKAKLHNQKRFKEKAEVRKTIKKHSERSKEKKEDDVIPTGAVPAYLIDREGASRSKILSNSIKQKRKEKAGKWAVPLPSVRTMGEDEMLKVIKTGKTGRRAWKRLVSKVTFVGPGFTRKPPKFERFIRPTGLRFTKAHVCHPELQTTFHLDILGVKKNPQGAMSTQLGVITKGTIIEVNVADLGLVTPGGKVVWGKYAQVTNNTENDGCINAVLLV